ncbi:MAG: DNA-binding protein [Planctomycetota bacterium]|nr:MAG: DNA-binding protein [Planctomycetota bacterium]
MPEAVAIKPELIRWAVARSGLPRDDLTKSFPKLAEWESGETSPTLKQLEKFAKKTMTPFGFMFLEEPPVEELPIPDFRTVADRPINRPSPNLIDTIHAMRRRQAWMRDYVIEQGQGELEFVGSAMQARNPLTLAVRIRDTLGLNPDWAEVHATWEEALRTLRESAERIGILVATSSVVGLNNRRPLDPQEFRGFVLCDSFAPLIFVNGADSKSAQMFTIAHELAHVWIGRDGLFNLINTLPHNDEAERFCNAVAAEFLVPAYKLHERWAEASARENPFKVIARWFKVSPLVVARRALDLKLIDKATFFAFYEQVQEEWKKHKAEERDNRKGGPNFYVYQDTRLGRRFAYAVVRAVREGRLLYREAYELTDLRGDTFDRYASLLIQRVKNERQ